MIQVFSSGGGTQSTAIAALIIQGKIEKPDFAVIADTGHEMPTTWQYLDAVVNPALSKVGLTVERIGREWHSMTEHGRAHESHNARTVIIPAFSIHNQKPNKLPNFCTNTWKVEVVERYMRKAHGVTVGQRVKWIGFSFDESRRWERMMGGEEYRRGLIRFPLVELRMKRQEAIRVVERMGWPTPPRSRCWMCPNQNDKEWREVQQNHPTEFAQAVAIDEDIRARGHNLFLHSTFRPLRDVDLSEEEDLFSGSCASGECFI